MRQSLSGTMRVLAVAAAAMVTMSLAVSAWAQPTQTTQSLPSKAPKVTTTQLKGEVAYLQGDYLVAKMSPSGTYRLFVLKPGKTATIDGVVVPLNKAAIGTMLTANVTVTETPVIDRTICDPEGQSLGRRADERHPDPRERREQTVRCSRRYEVRGGRQEARGDGTASGHEPHGDQDRGVAAHRGHDG